MFTFLVEYILTNRIMVEPVPITADPVSSDGSEESWILLDESDDGVKNRFSDSLCDDRCLIRNCIELSDDCGTTDDLDHEISEIKPLDLEENIENHAEIMEEIHDRLAICVHNTYYVYLSDN